MMLLFLPTAFPPPDRHRSWNRSNYQKPDDTPDGPKNRLIPPFLPLSAQGAVDTLVFEGIIPRGIGLPIF